MDLSVTMQHYFLAFTNPIAGREADFNEWYDSCHVGEVLRYGRGFVGCQRFKLSEEPLAGSQPPWQYLALYDIRYDDLTEFAERPWIEGAPRLTSFQGLLEDDHVGWVFTPQETPPAPGKRALQPFQLLLAWSTGRLGDNFIFDKASIARRGAAAHPCGLATPQRRAQQDSPWAGLVIYELAPQEANPPLAGFESAWRFVPISPYIPRSDV
jgi:hypothetical protein